MSALIFIIGLLIGCFIGFAFASFGIFISLKDRGYSRIDEIPRRWK